MTKLKDCHCEEQSDEAIPIQVAQADRNAPLSKVCFDETLSVTPAKAGVQGQPLGRLPWIPAFAQGCPGNESLCRGCTPSAGAALRLLSGCRDSESGARRALSKYGS